MSVWARLLVGFMVVLGVYGCANVSGGDGGYKPVRGQAGKDVIWIPTPAELVNRMLTMADVSSRDVVYDLGAGDGVIAITAAKQFGARSVGIEYDPKMAEFARRNVQQAGVADKVRIINGDIFVEDFSEATVVTMYLLPALNLKLRPTLLKMKPGTRLVSHAFDMAEWEPDQTASAANATAFLWIVPAQAGGEWELKGLEGTAPARLSIRQSFQKVGGTLTVGGVTQPLLGARIQGDKLSFQFMGPDNSLHSLAGTVTGSAMSGQVKAAARGERPIEARRL